MASSRSRSSADSCLGGGGARCGRRLRGALILCFGAVLAACLAVPAEGAATTISGNRAADVPVPGNLEETYPEASETFANCAIATEMDADPNEEEPGGPGFDCEFRLDASGTIVKARDEVLGQAEQARAVRAEPTVTPTVGPLLVSKSFSPGAPDLPIATFTKAECLGDAHSRSFQVDALSTKGNAQFFLEIERFRGLGRSYSIEPGEARREPFSVVHFFGVAPYTTGEEPSSGAEDTSSGFVRFGEGGRKVIVEYGPAMYNGHPKTSIELSGAVRCN